jgi:hypothetical protein
MSAVMEALMKAMQAAAAAAAVSQKRRREAEEAEERRVFNEQQGRNAQRLIAERLAREQREADMRTRQIVQDEADNDEVASILSNQLGPLTRRSPLMSASSKLDTPLNLAPGLFFGPHNFAQEYRFGPGARGFENPIRAPLAYSKKDYWRKGLWRVKGLKFDEGWWKNSKPRFRSQSQTKRVKAYNLYTNWLMETVGHIPERIMNTARIASVDYLAMRNQIFYGFGIGLGTHAPNYGRHYLRTHKDWYKQRDYRFTIMQETVNSIKSFVQRRSFGISKRRLSLVKEVQRASRDTSIEFRGGRYRDIIQDNFRFEFTGGRGRGDDFVTMFYPPDFARVANMFYKKFNEMFGRGYTLTMRAMPKLDIMKRRSNKPEDLIYNLYAPELQKSMLNTIEYPMLRQVRLIDGTLVPLAKPVRSLKSRTVVGFEEIVDAVYKELRKRVTA